MVELDHLAKSYPGPPQVSVLGRLDLVVNNGEFLALMGRSGSGKSTLLNIVGLLDRPSAGHVVLEGVDTSGMGERQRTALRGSRIGFVFQSPHLVAWRTVAENVVLGLSYANVPRAEALTRAQEALALVELSDRSPALPSQMSGGQAQRLAIARAIAIKPALLLCDEPTGNLDNTSSERVLALIDALHARGTTIVVVTHDPEVARHAERVLVLHDGQLHERGFQ